MNEIEELKSEWPIGSLVYYTEGGFLATVDGWDEDGYVVILEANYAEEFVVPACDLEMRYKN